MRSRLAVYAVAALLAAPSRCATPDSTGETGRVSDPQCFMEILHSSVSVSAAGIGATVRYWCDDPPVRHRISLRLQLRDTRGQWVTMSQTDDRAVPTRKARTMTATAGCIPGLWRARGTAVGAVRQQDGQVREFEPAQKDSREKAVTVDDCDTG